MNDEPPSIPPSPAAINTKTSAPILQVRIIWKHDIDSHGANELDRHVDKYNLQNDLVHVARVEITASTTFDDFKDLKASSFRLNSISARVDAIQLTQPRMEVERFGWLAIRDAWFGEIDDWEDVEWGTVDGEIVEEEKLLSW